MSLIDNLLFLPRESDRAKPSSCVSHLCTLCHFLPVGLHSLPNIHVHVVSISFTWCVASNWPGEDGVPYFLHTSSTHLSWTPEPLSYRWNKSIQFRMHGMTELLPRLSVPRCSRAISRRLTWRRKIRSSWDLDLDMGCCSAHLLTDQLTIFFAKPLRVRSIPCTSWSLHVPSQLPQSCSYLIGLWLIPKDSVNPVKPQ